ncbi:hypothetical protein BRADI_5g20009v3 [Brachypodium distachyon]|uniref:Uncharacterized protein n=1 Tax=Brachypodium distachyon TaxID=15368 RepID=A0A2K2CI73_BRADI|nr:hypothetical protein BRADI_5g20009v3 [Brachypodium distachyon]
MISSGKNDFRGVCLSISPVSLSWRGWGRFLVRWALGHCSPIRCQRMRSGDVHEVCGVHACASKSEMVQSAFSDRSLRKREKGQWFGNRQCILALVISRKKKGAKAYYYFCSIYSSTTCCIGLALLTSGSALCMKIK